MADQQPNYTRHPGRIFSLVHTEEAGDCRLLFVDDRELAILRRMIAVFPRYYWVWGIAGPQRDWGEIEWTNWDVIQDVVEELEGKLVGACDVQLMIDQLERIADQVTLLPKGCCDDGGGVPVLGYTERGTPYIGTQSPLGNADIDLSQYPNGETDTAYLAAKCEVANLIVEGLISTLNNMSLFSLAAMIQGGVAIGVIAVFAASLLTLPVVGAIAAVIAAAGLSEAVFIVLANSVADRREELVCALFQSDTATEAYDHFAVIVREISFYGVELGLLEEFVMSIVPIDVMNSLYTTVGLPAINVATPFDCSGCEESECYLYIASGIDLGGGSYQSVLAATSRQSIGLYFDSGAGCTRTVTLDSGSVVSNPSGYPVRWVCYNASFGVLYNQLSPPPSSLEFSKMIVDHYPQQGGSAFVISIQWSEVI